MGIDGGALVLTLKGERAVRARHHWVFSGAVARFPETDNGATVAVVGQDGTHLGYAYFNKGCSLCARMVSFDRTAPLDAIRERIGAALELRRKSLGDRTDAYRVCNAEADGVPGLVVDRYGHVAVIQMGTLGMDRLRDSVVAILQDLMGPAAIYERSDTGSRGEEGLKPHVGWLAGEPVDGVEIREDGLRYRVAFEASQKTGFYLDQREMRRLVQTQSQDRSVLDCFSYTGGFSVAALAGGARQATLVDTSAAALELAGANMALNGVDPSRWRTVRGDVFRYLREEPMDQDLVILDPPSFAKTRHEVPGALRGYREINRLVLARVRPGALVLTCSCTYHVDPETFHACVLRAAREVGRPVRVLQRHRLAADHPLNLFHPETEYLKSLFLWVG